MGPAPVFYTRHSAHGVSGPLTGASPTWAVMPLGRIVAGVGVEDSPLVRIWPTDIMAVLRYPKLHGSG